jgi:hypothetical protein
MHRTNRRRGYVMVRNTVKRIATTIMNKSERITLKSVTILKRYYKDDSTNV